MNNPLQTIKGQIESVTDQPLSQNPAAVYIASLGKRAANPARSRKVMLDNLNIVASIATSGKCNAQTMPWHTVHAGIITAVQTALSERYSAAKTNQAMAAFRGTLRQAWRLGQIPEETYRRAIDFEPVEGATLLAGRAIEDPEIKALSEICNDGTAKGARDKALLALLFGAGLRRSEIVGINFDDYAPDVVNKDGEIVGRIKVLHAKGNKQHEVYATNGTKAALESWIKIRGNQPGAIFQPISKADNIRKDGRLTAQSIFDIAKARAEQAGIKTLSPHDFRRTFCTRLLDADVDIATVSKMMGHASIQTTLRYDRRGEAAKMTASAKITFPL